MLPAKMLSLLTLPGVCFRQGYQLLLSCIFPILLLSSALSGCAGLYMPETVSWDEDVLLTGGQHLAVQRSVTYGPDAYGRSGLGRMEDQSIRFSFRDEDVEWENGDLWPQMAMPDILDVVNGTPVLVFRIAGWNSCEKYGFPQEGLVAFGYRNGRWDRIPFGDVPATLKVNLLQSTHAIQYWDNYKDKLITPAIKQDLDPVGSVSINQGDLVSEASKFMAASEQSCARIHPLPDPVFDAAKLKNMDAEVNALDLRASIVSSSTSKEKITPEAFRNAKGAWTGTGYLADSCKGVVETTQPIRQYDDKGSWSLFGYSLVLIDGSLVPIQQPGIKVAQAPNELESVVCGNNLIYTVKRKSRDQLVVHRFSYSGELHDVLRIRLPEVNQFFDGSVWPEFWEVMPVSGQQFNLSLGAYTYKGTVDQGGVLERRANYTVLLPR